MKLCYEIARHITDVKYIHVNHNRSKNINCADYNTESKFQVLSVSNCNYTLPEVRVKIITQF